MTVARTLGGASLILACMVPAGWLVHDHLADRRMTAKSNAMMLPDVTLEPATRPDMPGLLVTSLRSAGQAARHGLRVGDRIAAIDGRPVASLRDVARTMGEDSNPVLTLHLRRGDQWLDVRLNHRAHGDGANGA